VSNKIQKPKREVRALHGPSKLRMMMMMMMMMMVVVVVVVVMSSFD
jgi:hypothetical protein